MTSNFTTTGRPMSGGLQRALDNVTGSDRRITIAVLRASEGSLAPLLHALATELELCGLREADALRGMEAVFVVSDSDDRPWPQPLPGQPRVFDPETAVFSDFPPE